MQKPGQSESILCVSVATAACVYWNETALFRGLTPTHEMGGLTSAVSTGYGTRHNQTIWQLHPVQQNGPPMPPISPKVISTSSMNDSHSK